MPSIGQLDGILRAGAFEGPLRIAIHNFKYNSDTPLAGPLAALAAGRLANDRPLDRQDGELPVLVPVPLHPARRPTRQARGRQATEQTPEKARTAIVPEPNRRIQPWRRA